MSLTDMLEREISPTNGNLTLKGYKIATVRVTK